MHFLRKMHLDLVSLKSIARLCGNKKNKNDLSTHWKALPLSLVLVRTTYYDENREILYNDNSIVITIVIKFNKNFSRKLCFETDYNVHNNEKRE